MALNMDFIIKELTLLGEKTYTPKDFTLKEITGPDSLYLEGGFYKEGIQPGEETFRLDLNIKDTSTSNVTNSHCYWLISQIAMWDTNYIPITGLYMEATNAYLNPEYNMTKPSSRLLKDQNGYRYEMLGWNGIGTYGANAYFMAGGAFGPPMCNNNPYKWPTDWFVVEQTYTPMDLIIQSDNPNLMIMAISFETPIFWSTSTQGTVVNNYTYAPWTVKLKQTDELILDTKSKEGSKAYNVYTSPDKKGINSAWLLRFIIVKQADNTYKVYKSYIKDTNAEDVNKLKNVIQYPIYLKGEFTGLVKEFNPESMIANQRVDGMYDDLAELPHELKLVMTNHWGGMNNPADEIMVNGAFIWDNNYNLATNYARDLYVTNRKNQEYEYITCDYDNSSLKLFISFDSYSQASDGTTTFACMFNKSIRSLPSSYTSYKTQPFGIINIDGAAKGSPRKVTFTIKSDKEINVFALDPISGYDYGVNTAAAYINLQRHVSYIKSITHDKLVCDELTRDRMILKYVKTVKSKIYHARFIFTKTSIFYVWLNYTDRVYNELDPTLYVYYPVEDEMRVHTIQEVIEMDRLGELVNGMFTNY